MILYFAWKGQKQMNTVQFINFYSIPHDKSLMKNLKNKKTLKSFGIQQLRDYRKRLEQSGSSSRLVNTSCKFFIFLTMTYFKNSIKNETSKG